MATPPSSIGDVLFTKTQQRVLGLLYGNVEHSYYLNELVRLADMGKGTIKRELDRLAAVGLVTVSKRGNQNHYQANTKNPIYRELKGIVDKTFGVAGILSSALQPVLPSVDFAFVYGSVAKGEEHASSDIDVMLVGDSLSYTNIMNLMLPAEEQLGRSISPILYSRKEFDDKLQKQQSFLSRVLTQNKLWLAGEMQFASDYKDVNQ